MLRKRLMYWGTVLLLAMSLPALALAQTTVSGSAWADPPSLWGQTTIAYVSGPFTIPIGATGGPQVWDFSALTGQEEESSDAFLDPSGRPFAEFFPDANLCWGEETNLYLNASPSGVKMLGIGGDRDYFVFTPPGLMWKWPLTFGTSLGGEATMTGAGVEVTYTGEMVVDAWGTVKVPAGTFECLRVRRHSIAVSPDETEEEYAFDWVREDGWTLAQLDIDEWREDPNFSVTEKVEVFKSFTGWKVAVSASSWGALKATFR